MQMLLTRAKLSLPAVCMVLSLAGCTAPQPGVDVADIGPATEDEKVTVTVRVKTLAHGLIEPWAMDFLPDGRLLVTEKSGSVKLVDLESGQLVNLVGAPTVADGGQGGLMDVKIDPLFDQNQLVYFSYTVEENGLFSTQVGRSRLLDNRLVDHDVLFTAQPFFKERRHFGSKLLLDGEYLYITVGDRGHRELAQELHTHNGKILRLTRDGEVPADNPFRHVAGAKGEIWSYGHRNPQGLARHPVTGEIWASEHGPQGGDEINRIERGANYGWPVITYGEEYGGGQIGEGTHKNGMQQPLSHFTPSIGAAGMSFYSGDIYPPWEPSLLVAGLRQAQISRLQLTDTGVGKRTRLIANLGMRIRTVEIGPDGMIYALADGSRLLRLQPVL